MSEFKKFDNGKVPLHMLPTESLWEIAKAFQHGAAKYDEDNWRKGTSWNRLTSSMLRHLFAWKEGEDRDADSGCYHLANVGFYVLVLLYFQLFRLGTDDRQKSPQVIHPEDGSWKP